MRFVLLTIAIAALFFIVPDTISDMTSKEMLSVTCYDKSGSLIYKEVRHSVTIKGNKEKGKAAKCVIEEV